MKVMFAERIELISLVINFKVCTTKPLVHACVVGGKLLILTSFFFLISSQNRCSNCLHNEIRTNLTGNSRQNLYH